MTAQFLHIQALTWQTQAPKQQDCLLISDNNTCRILQDKAKISNLYEFNNDFIIAVADGIASSPYSGFVSKKLLQLLSQQFKNKIAQNTPISLQKIQDDLNDYFNQEKYQGAGSTLACAYYNANKNSFELRHLGDSRIYYFNSTTNKWTQLTEDHTYINELKKEITLDDNKQYASSYDILYHYFCIEYDYQITHFPPQTLTLNQGDYLLLCTDGVHDVLSCDKWLSPNNDLKEWLLDMQKLLHKNGVWDNMTMVLVKGE